MSENAYGFPHVLGLGNIPDRVGHDINRQIRQSNMKNVTKYQNNVKNAIDTFNTNELADKSFKKIGEVVGDQILTKGKAVEDTLKAVQKTYTGIRDAKSMMFNRVAAGPDESFASEAVRTARRAAFLEEDAAPEAKAALGGAKVLGGALQIGLAVDDIYNDSKGGFKKLNDAQKAGNIGEIAAGGVETAALGVAALETAGVALDASIVGAPIGLALNIAGGVLGLVAAGADLIGDKEEKNTLAENEATAKAAPIPQQAQIPIVGKALGTTGAEVKDNIQSGR